MNQKNEKKKNKKSRREFQIGDKVVTEFGIAVLERHRPQDDIYELTTIASSKNNIHNNKNHNNQLRLKLFVNAQALLFHAPPDEEDEACIKEKQQKLLLEQQQAVTLQFHQAFWALEKVRRLNLDMKQQKQRQMATTKPTTAQTVQEKEEQEQEKQQEEENKEEESYYQRCAICIEQGVKQIHFHFPTTKKRQPKHGKEPLYSEAKDTPRLDPFLINQRCLTCFAPCCYKHASLTFRRETGGLVICQHCESVVFPITTPSSITTTPSLENLTQQDHHQQQPLLAREQLERLVDIYDHLQLVLQFATDDKILPIILQGLQQQQEKDNQFRVGISSIGLVSGLLGVAGALLVLSGGGGMAAAAGAAGAATVSGTATTGGAASAAAVGTVGVSGGTVVGGAVGSAVGGGASATVGAAASGTLAGVGAGAGAASGIGAGAGAASGIGAGAGAASGIGAGAGAATGIGAGAVATGTGTAVGGVVSGATASGVASASTVTTGAAVGAGVSSGVAAGSAATAATAAAATTTASSSFFSSPLLMISFWFGTGATFLPISTDLLSLHQSANRVSERILAMFGILQSVRNVIDTIQNVKCWEEEEDYILKQVQHDEDARTPSSVQDSKMQGSWKGHLSSQLGRVLGGNSNNGAKYHPLDNIMKDQNLSRGVRFVARTGTAALNTTLGLMNATGGALAGVTVLCEARTIAQTLASIKAGNPCERVSVLQQIQSQIRDTALFPTTTEVNRSVQTFLATVDEQRGPPLSLLLRAKLDDVTATPPSEAQTSGNTSPASSEDDETSDDDESLVH